MKIAPPVVGFGFGTAIGSAELEEFCWRTDTRACALIFETIPPNPMNQGRSVSVALMSMYFLVQGDPSLLSAAPASPKYPVELIRMCILEAGVPPTCPLYNASAPLASGPAYLCASDASKVSEQFWREKDPAAARAAASACSWRCRLCTFQLAASSTSATASTSTSMATATIVNTAPRSSDNVILARNVMSDSRSSLPPPCPWPGARVASSPCPRWASLRT